MDLKEALASGKNSSLHHHGQHQDGEAEIADEL